MKIQLTAQQRMDMQTKGWTEPEELQGANGPPKGTYHNPRTGQEFVNMPIDPYSITHYREKGWRLGSAPPELKARYEATPKIVDPKTVTDSDDVKTSDVLINMILEMKKEISDLKGQLNKTSSMESIPELNTQLPLL